MFMWIKWMGTLICSRTIWPVWSFIINFCIWTRIQLQPSKRRHISSTMASLAKNVETVEDVGRHLSVFKWHKDRYWDWRPWISVFLFRSGRDDCDGAAVFTKWLFSLIGAEAKVITLIGRGWGGSHAVCVAKTLRGWRVYSNGNHIANDPNREVAISSYIFGENEWGEELYKRWV